MQDGSIREFLARLDSTSWVRRNLAGRRFLPPVEARLAEPDRPWPQPVRRALDLLGVARLP